MKRLAPIMLLLLSLGFGCAHSSGSKIEKVSNPIQYDPVRKDSPVLAEDKEKSTVTWDRIFDDMEFLIRWLDPDTIIFP
jgi:hypothetical protein